MAFIRVIMILWDVFTENKIAASQDLEELYNLYKLERDDRMMLREDSGHLSPELRLKVQVSFTTEGCKLPVVITSTFKYAVIDRKEGIQVVIF